jgi:chromosome partitioning protein
MSKVISFVVRKGGSGKTTSAHNVGMALAKAGFKVLFVDMDPQADLSGLLGVTYEQAEKINNLKSMLNMKLEYYIINDNLAIAPSFEDLDDAETKIVQNRDYKLKNVINQARDVFDFIVIDCPPSTGLLTRNALVASDYVFIPVQSQVLAYKGLIKVIDKINGIKKEMNPNLEIGGLFMTMLDRRDSINKEVAKLAKSEFKDLLMKTIIRKNTTLQHLPSKKQDIFTYDPSSSGAEDYMELAKEIITLTK